MKLLSNKVILRLMILSLLLGLVISSNAQHRKYVQEVLLSNSIPTMDRIDNIGLISCPYSLEPHSIYIPVDTDRILSNKGSNKKKTNSDIRVEYVNFSEEAKLAFEFIVEVMEELFPSDVPINILAQFGQLNGGTIAQAGPTALFRNFNNQVEINTWYPIALAEKITGRELNNIESQFYPYDIIVSIDEAPGGISWYYDFNRPEDIGNRYDFVTIVMHEVLHGLGMTAAADVRSNLGYLDNGGFPYIYDHFLENAALINLIDNFNNATLELGEALQSNDVFFGSNFFKINDPSNIPKLFAPARWNGGSSISHLDEGTYNTTPNSLMTPFANPNEVIHDPGIVMDMMYDMGWSLSLINLQHAPFSENVNQDFNFDVEVKTDFGFDSSSLKLFYFEGEFSIFNLNTEPLIYTGEGNTFRATLPAPNSRRDISYYYALDDNRDARITNPFNAPTRFYSFTWGKDDIKPEISHNPITSILENELSFTISTSLTDDFTGVDTAYAVVEIVGKSTTQVPLLPILDQFGTVLFEGKYTFETSINSSDILRYQIFVEDNASTPNIAVSPVNGFYNVVVIDLPSAIMSYQNDFDSSSDDWFGEGFEIITPDGFSSPAIHSMHPYGDATSQGLSRLEFTYQLRNPIIVSGANSTISFDEIVLVEPGDPGTSFGDASFWDYVSVEGKKIDSEDWIPLVGGWDIRDAARWSEVYNSAYVGCPEISNSPECISQGIGSEDLYKSRRIDIRASGDFIEGDMIQLRFLLFSDPAAYGWGWAIDNLSIQTESITTEVTEINNVESFDVFPNPVKNDNVHIVLQFEEIKNSIKVVIRDLTGRSVYLDSFVKRKNININLATTNIPAGIYFVSVSDDVGISTRKIVITK
ncbi:MAG: T9SS type A sorting domain-containing protein [Saprospiraceae bacterium]